MKESDSIVGERARAILAGTSKRDLDEDGMESAIAELLDCGEWPAVREALLRILLGEEAGLRHEALQFIYLLRGRGHPFDCAPTIAALYVCLELYEDLDANLVWTIARDLKGVPYLSDYDPYQDEAVAMEMAKLRLERDASSGPS